MKIVILAAGKGSRLSQSELPKPLTPIASGESILGRQLRCLQQFFPLADIHIVVGYQRERFQEAYHNCSFVISEHYAVQNTAKSLSLALIDIDDDILWMNGDVVFHPQVLETLVQTTGNVMVVNENKEVGEEEVKYATQSSNRIVEVSKTVTEPEGEAIGMNRFTREDLPTLKKHLSLCQDNDYFERAIERSIQEGIVVQPLVIATDLATEVDFPADLEHANQLLLGW